MAVFRTAFDRWVGTTPGTSLSRLVRETLDGMKTLTTHG